jgi:hypothetical protein
MVAKRGDLVVIGASHLPSGGIVERESQYVEVGGATDFVGGASLLKQGVFGQAQGA